MFLFAKVLCKGAGLLNRLWYLAQLEVVPHGGAVDGHEDRKDVLEAVVLF